MATSVQFETRALDSVFAGPAWNNSNEYPSLQSNEFQYDQQQVDSLFERLMFALGEISPLMTQPFDDLADHEKEKLIARLQAVYEMKEHAQVLLQNMGVFAFCLLSVDGTHAEARKATSDLTSQKGKLEALTKPATVYLMNAPETLLEKFFAHAHVKPFEFVLREQRKVADTLLSADEEALVASLEANGPMAFGALYDQLSSSIRCHYEDPTTKEFKELGLSEATVFLSDSDEAKRKAAWNSIQRGWKSQETAAAAVLNGLAGWRLELTERRSKRRRAKNENLGDLHFLDLTLHENRIRPETLSAMYGAVHAKIEIPRRALRAMAKRLGKKQLDPWDIRTPAPQTPESADSSARLVFERGFNMIRDSFYNVDPAFADFAETMKKNRWIEGRQLSNKRPMAYCTEFAKSNSPRIFMTYMGSLNDVRILAHELGHAYHSWVMRDLPRAQQMYPHTIAETASIFAETALTETLMSRAREASDKTALMTVAWQNAEAATSLLNISARFDFEKSFYERRQSGFVPAEELNQLTAAAWEKWYGDTLSSYEKQYWMTKLHFSIPNVSFYNFPYTFGYLFSLGIYSLRAELGQDFWPMYQSLLRDTGRMTAEDLAKKYLKADLTSPAFWMKSLAIVEKQIAEFESI